MSWTFCFVELWTFWIKIARYPAYRVEIESSTPLKPHYCITRTSSLRIWMKNISRLLCCSTCLKLSTASSMTTYYQNRTYWVSASAVAWFKSYLSLRKQVVRIGSDLSAHYAACDLLDHQRLGWKLKRFDHFKMRRMS